MTRKEWIEKNLPAYVNSKIVTDREYTNQYILLTKAENKKGEQR